MTPIAARQMECRNRPILEMAMDREMNTEEWMAWATELRLAEQAILRQSLQNKERAFQAAQEQIMELSATVQELERRLFLQ